MHILSPVYLRCIRTSTSIWIQPGLIASTYALKKLQSGLNPDSPIHLPSRIQSGFRWIRLDFVGAWQRFKGSKVHITTDPARGMVYNTDKKTDNDTMLFVIILVIKKKNTMIENM